MEEPILTREHYVITREQLEATIMYNKALLQYKSDVVIAIQSGMLKEKKTIPMVTNQVSVKERLHSEIANLSVFIAQLEVILNK